MRIRKYEDNAEIHGAEGELFFKTDLRRSEFVFFMARISLQKKVEVEAPNLFGYCKSSGSIMRRRDGGRRAGEALRVRKVSGLQRAPRSQSAGWSRLSLCQSCFGA